MSNLTKWSLLDQELLRCAANHMSPAQMEAELDIPAAQAAVRVRELLRSTDIWTEVEERRLLLHSMYSLKGRLEQGIDIDNPKSVEAYTKLLDLIGKRLDTVSQITETELDRVTSAQARKLLQLIMTATDYARELLSQEYPESIMDDVEHALQEGLRRAAEEIEA